jgi:hypothetical protein
MFYSYWNTGLQLLEYCFTVTRILFYSYWNTVKGQLNIYIEHDNLVWPGFYIRPFDH